ncbi:hypothetical protein KIPB_014229, partial [Kipferlia bialata]
KTNTAIKEGSNLLRKSSPALRFRLHLLLAEASELQGTPELALRQLGGALRIRPFDIGAQKAKIRLLLELKREVDALSVCSTLVSKHPHDPSVWCLQGKTLALLGDTRGASKAYRRALDQFRELGEGDDVPIDETERIALMQEAEAGLIDADI